MRYFYFLFFLFLIEGSLQAQQVGMYNHYFFKPMLYNPAFAGNSGDDMQATMISRSQWTGFTNAPQLNIFMLDGPVKSKKIGLGLTLISERRGINQRTGGNLTYSYRVNISEDMHLLFGFSAGLINQTIDFSKAVAENGNDPTLFSNVQQKTTFDGNGGLAFIWKGLEIGASALQLLGNRINYVDNSGVRSYYTQARHFTTSAKYKFYLSEEKGLSVNPQILLRIVPGTPLQYDGNLNLDWQNKCWIGATYKSNYAVSVNAGICVHKKLSIGYSYEFITADLGKYSGISHEIMVNFKFGARKKEPIDSTAITPAYQAVKDSASEKRMDSLQERLTENQDRIRQLNKKLEQQAKALEQTQAQLQTIEKNIQNNAARENTSQNNTAPSNNGAAQKNSATGDQSTKQETIKDQNTGNKTVVPVNTNENNAAPDLIEAKKTIEDGVPIAIDGAIEYKNPENMNPKPGFYIIVGTFFYRDFAIAETQRFKNRGFKESNWIYSEPRKYNYIFTYKLLSKQEAIIKVKEIHQSGSKDAWILELK